MNPGAAPIPLPIRSTNHGASSFRFPSRYARFGEFELDIQRQELYRSGIRIKLQTKVYEALLVLLEAPHEVISREVIRQRLWPGDSLVNFDANVNTTVNKLRQVLGDSPDQPAYVETIPRKGYSFVANVEFAGAPLRGIDATHDSSEMRSGIARRLLGIHSGRWLTAAVVALLVSGMLFGAALILYTQRAH
jgi:DNA-binding winged helix-turn-helix (wHTH) protein